MAGNTKSNKKTKSFEQTLWETADKLRGTVESSEYKHVVLSLIFLKFVSDKFEARKQELIQEGKEAYIDMVEFYTMKNVFYLPENSRWSYMRIPRKVTTQSTGKWPPNPWESDHPVHGKMATQSTGKWPGRRLKDQHFLSERSDAGFFN